MSATENSSHRPKRKPQTAYDSLTRILGIRDHSEFELFQKLTQKNKFEEAEIREAIAIAHKHGWIKPPDVLIEDLERRLYERGKGHLYITNAALAKGLPSPELDSEKESHFAILAVEKKFGSLNFENREKAAKFLKQRGFTSSAIYSALSTS